MLEYCHQSCLRISTLLVLLIGCDLAVINSSQHFAKPKQQRHQQGPQKERRTKLIPICIDVPVNHNKQDSCHFVNPSKNNNNNTAELPSTSGKRLASALLTKNKRYSNQQAYRLSKKWSTSSSRSSVNRQQAASPFTKNLRRNRTTPRALWTSVPKDPQPTQREQQQTSHQRTNRFYSKSQSNNLPERISLICCCCRCCVKDDQVAQHLVPSARPRPLGTTQRAHDGCGLAHGGAQPLQRMNFIPFASGV